MAMPNLRLIEAPDGLPIELADTKAHLRVDFDDEDATISAMLEATVDALDGKAGWLFRCIMPQTWRQAHDGGFPAGNGGRISLPLGPVLDADKIESIEYTDAAGETQTLDPSAYRFYPADGLDDAYILPAFATSWPSTRCDVEAVVITYVAGYADVAGVPKAIKQAILLQVGDLYKNRESFNRSEMQLNPTVERLLVKYRRVMV